MLNEKQKRTIEKVKDIQKCLGLQNWEINVVFNKIKKKVGDYNVSGMCDCNARYLQAEITFKDDDPLMETIIHELCHCIPSELVGYCEANKLGDNWMVYFNERLVSQITHIFVNLLKDKIERYDTKRKKRK
jgi:hypothetical protein